MHAESATACLRRTRSFALVPPDIWPLGNLIFLNRSNTSRRVGPWRGVSRRRTFSISRWLLHNSAHPRPAEAARAPFGGGRTWSVSAPFGMRRASCELVASRACQYPTAGRTALSREAPLVSNPHRFRLRDARPGGDPDGVESAPGGPVVSCWLASFSCGQPSAGSRGLGSRVDIRGCV